jgi:ribosomal protein S18 acetylase RimI-like enzyme
VEIEFYSDAKKFSDLTFEFLCKHEAENCLLIGLVDHLTKNPNAYEAAYLWAVVESNQVVGAAWFTPPYPLGLTRMPIEAIKLVFEESQKIPNSPTAIIGPLESASHLKLIWENVRNERLKTRFNQRIFQISSVIPPSPVDGEIRAATKDDLELIIDWNMRFVEDCKLGQVDRDNARKIAERDIETGRRFLWIVDGKPVSMTGVQGKTPHGIRVSWVYTPKEFRHQGHASALVANVSDKMIRQGNDFCFLYTDLANPTSNSIYQKIGYRPVADAVNFEVEK